MGFYLRKSFRMGPVRLNLSKSGLGLSGGVTGARMGINSKGRAYVHGGRHGLYYRKHLSGKSATRQQAEQGGCSSLLVTVLLIGLGLIGIVWVLEHPWILLAAASAGLGFAGFRLWKRHQLTVCKRELDRVLVNADQVPVPSEIDQLKAQCSQSGLTATLRQDIYQAVLDRVLDDKRITEAEQRRLEAAREVLQLEEAHLRSLHKELFLSAWLEAIEDNRITQAETQWIEELLEGLELPKEEVRRELEFVNELIEAQQLTPPLPSIDPEEWSAHLQQSETLFACQLAQVLSRRGRGENISWRTHRDGTLLLTDKRLMVIGDGTTQLRLDDITDVEIDFDQGQLVLHKRGISRPTWIRTTKPFLLGHRIELLQGDNFDRSSE